MKLQIDAKRFMDALAAVSAVGGQADSTVLLVASGSTLSVERANNGAYAKMVVDAVCEVPGSCLCTASSLTGLAVTGSLTMEQRGMQLHVTGAGARKKGSSKLSAVLNLGGTDTVVVQRPQGTPKSVALVSTADLKAAIHKVVFKPTMSGTVTMVRLVISGNMLKSSCNDAYRASMVRISGPQDMGAEIDVVLRPETLSAFLQRVQFPQVMLGVQDGMLRVMAEGDLDFCQPLQQSDPEDVEGYFEGLSYSGSDYGGQAKIDTAAFADDMKAVSSLGLTSEAYVDISVSANDLTVKAVTAAGAVEVTHELIEGPKVPAKVRLIGRTLTEAIHSSGEKVCSLNLWPGQDVVTIESPDGSYRASLPLGGA